MDKEKIKLLLKSIFFWAILNIVFLIFFFFYLFPLASEYNGFYYVGLNSISIKPQNLTLYEVRYVVNHEGGHYLWYKCLNQSLKDYYNTIYWELNKSEEWGFCNYHSNIYEDFASSYAHYITGYWNCPAKADYFRELGKERLKCR